MKIEKIPLDTLQFDPANARKHDAKNLEAIKGSLAKFGQQKPIVVGKGNVVIAGNGTLEAARALGWPSIAVVRTELEGAEAIAFALADNRTAELAAWDDKVLGATLHSLREIDFDLGAIGFDTSYLDGLNAATSEDGAGAEGDDDYTKKIQVPIYEPKGERPELDSLVDVSKTEQLFAQIEAASAPEDVKTFLKLAAARHSVFNYEKIAEFYAHAPEDVQALMEASALVIIDFDKAIENGFVALSEALAEAYQDDE